MTTASMAFIVVTGGDHGITSGCKQELAFNGRKVIRGGEDDAVLVVCDEADLAQVQAVATKYHCTAEPAEFSLGQLAL